MPSFGLLSEDSLETLASYVTHLSMRGQVEYNVMKDLLSADRGADLMERLNGYLEAIARWWKEAESSLIRPDPNVLLPTGDRSGQNRCEMAFVFSAIRALPAASDAIRTMAGRARTSMTPGAP